MKRVPIILTGLVAATILIFSTALHAQSIDEHYNPNNPNRSSAYDMADWDAIMGTPSGRSNPKYDDRQYQDRGYDDRRYDDRRYDDWRHDDRGYWEDSQANGLFNFCYVDNTSLQFM